MFLNEKYSDRNNENWYQGQFRYGEFKNRGHEFWKSSRESEKEEKEEKTKNTRIATTKIGTEIKFGTTNSKIAVLNLKKQISDHTIAPPLKIFNVPQIEVHEVHIWKWGTKWGTKYDEFKNRGLKS